MVNERSKRILIIGMTGYVGPMLIRQVRDKFPDSKLVGFGLGGIGFSDRKSRNSSLTRFKTLNQHIAEGRLSTDLYWP
jgi:hypothetical protein